MILKVNSQGCYMMTNKLFLRQSRH